MAPRQKTFHLIMETHAQEVEKCTDALGQYLQT